MPSIFINYRAQDQAGYAALLDRELTERFGVEAVFRASRSIPPGADFAQEILDNLRQCQVLLAVMGPDWLAVGRRGRLPVGGEPDWVHREIAEAFLVGIRVVPILVEDAGMPPAAELSADIAALVRCQYLRVHHRNIDSDIRRLVDEMIRLVPGLHVDRLHPHELPGRDVRLYQVVGAAASATRIGLITGTIRRVRCADVWVNSENTDMEMARITEFSVSAIIRYWGAHRDQNRVIEDLVRDELAAVVGTRRLVLPAAAFVTGAGALTESNNVHHVVHVAAVQGEPGTGYRQINDVGSCVTAALIETDRLAAAGKRARTILFPLLGTGTAGGDVWRTARMLLRSALDYLEATPQTALLVVYFLAYTDMELAVFTQVLRSLPQVVPFASDAATVRLPTQGPRSLLPPCHACPGANQREVANFTWRQGNYIPECLCGMQEWGFGGDASSRAGGVD